MSDMAIDAARMMDMLPDEDKNFAYEFIKKLVKAWDPDFTKVTPEEAQRIKAAEESGFVVNLETNSLENAAALSAARYTADEMFSRIRTNQTSTGRKPL